ncbi:DUF924 family protein [Brevundimonas sp. 2R-24]|uniref:DUF924 family protein n=1 Tax=Peiella sedimenti TaxID=3061083 RepID=A0ABT8SLR8_9CAUL|nr:DUF924 family protein [Caulobacteraceae bacterium XZ-24]
MTTDLNPSDVVGFWKAAGPDKWYAKNDAFDAACITHMLDAHLAAAARELDAWAETAEGSLALLILLDQIPRNVYRGTAHQFATDPLALQFARRAVEAGHDQQIEGDIRRFCYMPFQHSEDLADQEQSLKLFQAMDRDPSDRWAEHHHGVIARFGRFPHRNAVLGRATTPEEAAFLKEDGFKG